MSPLLLLASGSSSSSRNWSYDVFPSFSGEDVRKTLLSHFLRELERKSIVAFKDNEMERSHSISPKLVEAIRSSKIAVVVFSKSYASSSWCLNELLEIMKCKEEFGQKVMPIFYGLDPTHVRKHIGDFGEAFEKTCQKQKENAIVDQWKKALTSAANLLGYHSMNWGSDAAGIEEISNDISRKLYPTPSNDFEDFVGIKDHITNMVSLLRLESKEVRMVGIWGTSGIGKTTIARALFSYLSRHFQDSVFIDIAFISKSKEAYGRPYLYDHNMKLSLQENFLCKMNMNGAIEEKLKHRKVLTIIDDLDDQYVLDALAGKTKWYGSGSRIIGVTTNKHLLKAHDIDDDSIYEVDLPSYEQALEIFCRAAFKQNFPPCGLERFAYEVVQRVGNLPLGLTILGSSLRGKNKEACLKMLPRLRRNLNGEIEKTLRFSYDGLRSEEDKAIFRHIACFFDYDYEAKDIKLFLEDSELDVDIGLDNLFDKSLILEADGMVEMHKLLEEMGRNIVRRQSDEPGKREFLFDSKDISQVLQECTGTKKILGINWNTDNDNELQVHENAFKGMHNLRFLQIQYQGKELPENFNYLPPKLKLLIWKEYPMRCLPSNFCPESLIKLEMQNSNLKTLWEGVKSLGCLKDMDLSYSPNLKEISDLSMATNLENLKLNSCESLVELPSSIRNLNKLITLSMNNCTKLEILPTGIDLKSLDYLNFTGCKVLRTFPEISTNISTLLLGGTSVEELPSSIRNLNKLITLSMENCTKLEILPTGIDLKSLHYLNFSGCKMLRTFPEISTNISTLYMEGTSVEELPCNLNLDNLTNLFMGDGKGDQVRQGIEPLVYFMSVWSPSLTSLSLTNMSSLVELPSSFQNLNTLKELEITDCVNLRSLPHRINIKSLDLLDLSGCSRLSSFPNISTKIIELNLSGTGIKEVPWWIEKFSRLQKLWMESCSKLEYVHLNLSKLKLFKHGDFRYCEALTGVNLSGYASGGSMKGDNIAFSSLPDNRFSEAILKCRLRKSKVDLDFFYCFHLDHVLLPQHSDNVNFLKKEFRLYYPILQKNYHEVRVDLTFDVGSHMKFNLEKWGIRISYTPLPYACEDSSDSDSDSSDEDEEYESSEDSDSDSEDISSPPQNQFVNPNTLPHFTHEDHPIEQREESGGSDVDTERSSKRKRIT